MCALGPPIVVLSFVLECVGSVDLLRCTMSWENFSVLKFETIVSIINSSSSSRRFVPALNEFR